MKRNAFACLMLVMLQAETATAGGLLTNTNQNIAFLRNPARDAAIGIDGVYSNPAGVAFLDEGLHLSVNIQNAHQTRTITTGYELFKLNANNPGNATHTFKGEADAPLLPSLQAAWNKGKWSFQFNFAVTGGGGKCAFDNGLGSFEQIVSSIPSSISGTINQLYSSLDAIDAMFGQTPSGHQMGNSYAYDSYMRGRQYYYGFTFGAARRLTDNLSVYGGLRLLYGSANYYGYVKNIQVEHSADGQTAMVNASSHFSDLAKNLYVYTGKLQGVAAAYAKAGKSVEAAQLNAQATQLQTAAASVEQLAAGTEDIELNCDQTGWGIAPVIGVDYKAGILNLAAKYEFKTRMRLKNKSANSKSAESISMLDKFADGEKVAEDSPALLTVGAQVSVLPQLRLNAGWHHYFDVDTKQYTKDMLGDTNEYLFGAEYDICKRLQVSAGVQKTKYDLKDAAMSDISFTVDSYSFGFGIGVNLTDNIKVNAAYFQTNYTDYDMTTAVSGSLTKTDSFTRTNRVFGLGVDFKL